MGSYTKFLEAYKIRVENIIEKNDGGQPKNEKIEHWGEQKGIKRSPKDSKRGPRGCQREPTDCQSQPTESQKATRMHPKLDV